MTVVVFNLINGIYLFICVKVMVVVDLQLDSIFQNLIQNQISMCDFEAVGYLHQLVDICAFSKE